MLFLFFAENAVWISFDCELEDFSTVYRHDKSLEYFHFRVTYKQACKSGHHHLCGYHAEVDTALPNRMVICWNPAKVLNAFNNTGLYSLKKLWFVAHRRASHAWVRWSKKVDV